MQAALLSMMIQQQGQQQSLTALGQANQQAQDAVNQAIGYYEPYYDAGLSGLDMLTNALGLNGAQGNAAATSAFQASPGYNFTLDQGIGALDRSAAARGLLNSGNQTGDVLNYATGLANQDYNNWLSGVGGLSQLGMTATQGMAGQQDTLASLATQFGRDQANLFSNTSNSIADRLFEGQLSDAASSAQAKQNTLSGIMGGLNLAGAVATAPLTGGASLATTGAKTAMAPGGMTLLGKLFGGGGA
jgi:hypothetical protein